MTAPEITLIITTVATGIVSIIGAIKGSGNSRKLDEVKDKALEQDFKLDTIHRVTNGNLDKAIAKIAELTDENTKLKEDIVKFNQRQRIP